MSKKVLIAVAASMLASSPALAAEYSEIRDGYSTEAFADADDRWRRLTSNRYDGCSRYGDKSKSRLDVLVDSYLAIGQALDANDEAATMAATERLSRAINVNDRFGECWKSIARRGGVTREFRDMIAKM